MHLHARLWLVALRALRPADLGAGILRQVSVLGNVTGAASETRQSAESVLTASQAVEAAAAELRREVKGFLALVAA